MVYQRSARLPLPESLVGSQFGVLRGAFHLCNDSESELSFSPTLDTKFLADPICYLLTNVGLDVTFGHRALTRCQRIRLAKQGASVLLDERQGLHEVEEAFLRAVRPLRWLERVKALVAQEFDYFDVGPLDGNEERVVAVAILDVHIR